MYRKRTPGRAFSFGIILLGLGFLSLAFYFGPENLPGLARRVISGMKAEIANTRRPAKTSPMSVIIPEEKKFIRDALGAMRSPTPAILPAAVPRPARRRFAPRLRRTRPGRGTERAGGPDFRIFSVAKPKRFSRSKKFRVQGRVYDLKTLEPVRGARIFFRNPHTGKYRKVSTDRSGAYRVVLRANLDGYYVTIFKSGYSSKYSRDWEPSLKSFNSQRRRELAAEHLARPNQKTLIFSNPGEVLERDFVLIRT